VKGWLRHAFAVDPPGPAEPDEAERAAVDIVVNEVGRRGLVTPALLFLEASRGLNVIGAAMMHFFAPFATVLIHPERYQAFAGFLERRGSIEYICRRLEAYREEHPRT
jgi:hypothetical protein